MPGGGIARTARQGFHQNMGMFNELRERNQISSASALRRTMRMSAAPTNIMPPNT